MSGLGFGLGLFYVGERQGDLDNSFELDDYLRIDAALYYRRDRLNAAINFRNLFDTDYFRASDGGNLFLFRDLQENNLSAQVFPCSHQPLT